MSYPKAKIIAQESDDNTVSIPEENLVAVNREWRNNQILARSFGEFAGKAFTLDEAYCWQIVRDSADLLILVPTKKNSND